MAGRSTEQFLKDVDTLYQTKKAKYKVVSEYLAKVLYMEAINETLTMNSINNKSMKLIKQKERMKKREKKKSKL